MPKVLGDVAFVVYPDTTRFRPEADAGIKAALAGMRASIPLTADARQAEATFTALAAKLSALSKTLTSIPISADDKKLNAQLLDLKAKVAVAAKNLQNLPMDVDTTKIDLKIASSMVKLRAFSQQLTQLSMNLDSKKFDAKVLDAQAKLKTLQRQASEFQVDLDTKRAALHLIELENQADRLQAKLDDEEADIDTAEVRAKLDVVLAEIELINSEARKIELVANYFSLMRAVAVAKAELTGLQAQARDIPLMNSAQIDKVMAQTAAEIGLITKLRQEAADVRMGGIDPVGLARSAAEIAGIDARMQKLTTDTAASTGIWATLTGWLGRFAAANQKIGWGAMIGGIAGWHIVLDAAIEAVIIATTSLLALGAGFAGVYRAVDELAYHTKASLNVMTAYGVDAGTLAGALDNLQKSLAPQVIEAFGGALNLASGQTNALYRAAHQVVDLFDTWIAKLDIWANSQKNVGGLLQSGVGFLSQMGKAIGILAQAIDNLLTKDPGVAHYLLDMIQGFAEVLNLFSKLPGPIVTATLMFHGLWVWVSVLGGVFGKLTAPIVGAVTWIVKQGTASTAAATATEAHATATEALTVAIAEQTGAVTALTAALTGEAVAETAVAEGAVADTATQAADALATEADAAANAANETSLLGRAFSGALGFLRGFGTLVANIAEKGLVALGGALRTAGAGLAAFGRGLLALLANPLTWFLLATAAIIAMAIEARKATPDVAKLIDTLNQKINSDQASQAMTDISDAIGQANAKINEINSGGGVATFNQNWHTFGGTWQNISAEVMSTAGAFGKALGDIPQSLASWPNLKNTVMDFGHAFHDFFGHPGAPAEMARNISLLNQQINNWLGQDRNLFAETGALMFNQDKLKLGTMNYTQALTLMNLAGVRSTDSLAVMSQKVDNLVKGYAEMGAGGTQLQASINAVTFATEMQDSKVSELNQGWDAFFKLVSGGSSDFLGFAKQVNGMNEAFGGATQGTVALTIANGKVSESIRNAAGSAQQGKATMTGLNDASIAAQQTLLQTASAANTQMDSLTSLSAAAGLGQHGMDLLQQATKDMLSQMLPAAQGSQQMTDVLYALAQRGGYKGADSFKELSHWIDTNSGSVKNAKPGMADLQGIVTTMTTKAGNLADDVKNLSIALGQNLTQAMASAVVMASGGQKAMNDFANAVMHSKFNSDQQKTSALELAQSLLLATGNVNDAKTQFMSFALGALHLTKDEATQLWDEISPKLTPAVKKSGDTAAQAKKDFEAFAGQSGNQGLGLTTKKADELWKKLDGNLGATLSDLAKSKAPGAKAEFEKLAGDPTHGLGLTKDRADKLWNSLHGNLGKELGSLGGPQSDALKSKANFEAWAGSGGKSGMSLTKKQADELYTALGGGGKGGLKGAIDQLPAGKTIKLNVDTTSANNAISNVQTRLSQVAQAVTGRLGVAPAAAYKQHGGLITAGTGPTADDVHILASRGEYVIRAASVSRYGLGIMNALNKGDVHPGAVGAVAGFRASGGIIGYAAGGPARMAAGGPAGGGGAQSLAGAINVLSGALEVLFAQRIPAWMQQFASLGNVTFLKLANSLQTTFATVLTAMFTAKLPAWLIAAEGGFRKLWNKAAADFVSGLQSALAAFFASTVPGWLAGLENGFKRSWQVIAGTFQGTFVSPVQAFFGTTIPAGFASLTGKAHSTFDDVAQYFSGHVDKPVSSAISAWSGDIVTAFKNGWNSAAGTFNNSVVGWINANILKNLPGSLSIQPIPQFAGGGMVHLGSGPAADDVHALLSKGEVVVPTSMVSAGAVDHLRGKLPGFAGGGYVGYAAGGAVNQSPVIPGRAPYVDPRDVSGGRWVHHPGRGDAPIDLNRRMPHFAAGGAVEQSMLNFMMSKQGQAYSEANRWGKPPWDCSSLLWTAASSSGVPIPQSAAIAASEADWFGAWSGDYAYKQLSQIQTGDIVFSSGAAPGPSSYGGIGHVGMAASPSTLISALGTQYGVTTSPIGTGGFVVGIRLGGVQGKGILPAAGPSGWGGVTQMWQDLEGLTTSSGTALSGTTAKLAQYVQGGSKALLALASKGAQAIFDAIWKEDIAPAVARLPKGTMPGAFIQSLAGLLDKGISGYMKQKDQSAQQQAAATSGVPAGMGPTSADAAAAQAYARSRLGAFGWQANQFGPLQALWTQESGWNRLARNPSSGAYGIPQALPASKMGPLANPPTSSASAQIDWGLNYIKSVYGSPAGAEAHELASHWYDQGGVLKPGLTLVMNGTGHDETILPHTPHEVMGYAAGGLAGYQQKLGGDQYREILDYNAFRAAALSALAHAAAGSAVARYHTSIINELGTLAGRQGSEAAAYKPVVGAHVTAAEISHFISMMKEEIKTTQDVGLGKVPGTALGLLRAKLEAMATAAAQEPSLPGSAGGGPFPAWKTPSGTIALGNFYAQVAAEQKTEALYYKHVADGFRASLAKAKPGAWDYAHRAVIRSELATLAKGQNNELAAYTALMTRKPYPPVKTVLDHFTATLKSEAATTRDADLSHVPGGHPALMQGLYAELGNLYQLVGSRIGDPVTPFGTDLAAPALPKRGTPAWITLAGIYGWMARGGIVGFDRGGVLPPGLTAAWNGTGRNEVISPVPPGGVIGPGGMTPGEMQLINRMDKLIAIMGAAPAAYSAALNNVAGRAANRGYYGSVR